MNPVQFRANSFYFLCGNLSDSLSLSVSLSLSIHAVWPEPSGGESESWLSWRPLSTGADPRRPKPEPERRPDPLMGSSLAQRLGAQPAGGAAGGDEGQSRNRVFWLSSRSLSLSLFPSISHCFHSQKPVGEEMIDTLTPKLPNF